MNLNEVSAIVTGAASGLGAATARTLALSGASVFALDLPVAIGASDALPNVVYLPTDVTQVDQVESAVERVSTGGPPLRVVVNCAGIAPSMRIVGRSGRHDLASFARVVQVNLIGTFNVLAVT